jgi:hypothetical protein
MSKRILEVNGRSPDREESGGDSHLRARFEIGRARRPSTLDNAMLLEGLPVSPETMVPRIQQLLEELTQAKSNPSD